MHINKGNALLRGNPQGTHTERKGNAVTGLNSAELLLLLSWRVAMLKRCDHLF